MYKNKLSAEEVMEAIKLRMNYDTSKTLTENKHIVSEQKKEESTSDTLSDEDLLGDTNILKSLVQTVLQYPMPIPGFGPSTAPLQSLLDPLGINLSNIVFGRRIGVKGVVDALDGFVDVKDLGYVLSVIKGLDGKCYYDDVENKTISATERFLQLYSEDEGGDDLISDIQSVGTTTLATGAEKIKRSLVKIINDQIAKGCGAKKDEKVDQDCKQNPNQEKCKKINVSTSGYKQCSGTYTQGCKSDVITKVQGCLGVTPDGKFGPKTLAALKTKGFTSFTDADVSKICGDVADTDVDTDVDVDADNPEDLINS